MKCVLSPLQNKHYPEGFLVNGLRQKNPETPERIDILLKGALAAGLEQVCPDDYGIGPIAAVHTPEYLEFLQMAYQRWQRIPDAAPEITPNIHPTNRDGVYPASVIAQAGYHMSDASAPIGAQT